MKNKNCGDIINLEVIIKNQKFKSMRYETESCIYCQASASFLAYSIKQFSKILLIAIFLSSCKTSTIKQFPLKNTEENINENSMPEKKRMEIKFSCGDDGISKYLDDGWIVLKEDTQEKICTWKSVPASKDCDMEKDKGCKITKPDKIGEEKSYLLEK